MRAALQPLFFEPLPSTLAQHNVKLENANSLCSSPASAGPLPSFTSMFSQTAQTVPMSSPDNSPTIEDNCFFFGHDPNLPLQQHPSIPVPTQAQSVYTPYSPNFVPSTCCSYYELPMPGWTSQQSPFVPVQYPCWPGVGTATYQPATMSPSQYSITAQPPPYPFIPQQSAVEQIAHKPLEHEIEHLWHNSLSKHYHRDSSSAPTTSAQQPSSTTVQAQARPRISSSSLTDIMLGLTPSSAATTSLADNDPAKQTSRRQKPRQAYLAGVMAELESVLTFPQDLDRKTELKTPPSSAKPPDYTSGGRRRKRTATKRDLDNADVLNEQRPNTPILQPPNETTSTPLKDSNSLSLLDADIDELFVNLSSNNDTMTADDVLKTPSPLRRSIRQTQLQHRRSVLPPVRDLQTDFANKSSVDETNGSDSKRLRASSSLDCPLPDSGTGGESNLLNMSVPLDTVFVNEGLEGPRTVDNKENVFNCSLVDFVGFDSFVSNLSDKDLVLPGFGNNAGNTTATHTSPCLETPDTKLTSMGPLLQSLVTEHSSPSSQSSDKPMVPMTDAPDDASLGPLTPSKFAGDLGVPHEGALFCSPMASNSASSSAAPTTNTLQPTAAPAIRSLFSGVCDGQPTGQDSLKSSPVAKSSSGKKLVMSVDVSPEAMPLTLTSQFYLVACGQSAQQQEMVAKAKQYVERQDRCNAAADGALTGSKKTSRSTRRPARKANPKTASLLPVL